MLLTVSDPKNGYKLQVHTNKIYEKFVLLMQVPYASDRMNTCVSEVMHESFIAICR